MNIAVFPKALDEEPHTFVPNDAPDLVVDWERLGRYVQDFRTVTGASRTRLAKACGISRAQIARAEQGFPLSANNVARLCVFLQRDTTFFCKTLSGWQPHHPE